MGLICIAAYNSQSLTGVPKDQLLVFLSKMILGERLGFISAVSILLACFTTSIALTVAYADFLFERRVVKKYNHALFITLTISYVMSNFGLKGITYITEPILRIAYPLLLTCILVTLFKHLFFFNKKKATVGV